MSPRTMLEMWEEAYRDPGFHKELAILEFTEELYRVMQEQGVSETELARRVGVSQPYIARVLGGANFTLATMTKLAMALGMELKMHLAPFRTATEWHDEPAAAGYRDRAEEALRMAEAALPAAVETHER